MSKNLTTAEKININSVYGVRETSDRKYMDDDTYHKYLDYNNYSKNNILPPGFEGEVTVSVSEGESYICNSLGKMLVTGHELTRVKKIIFNPPATIVIWEDDHKEVVKCSSGEVFNCEVGVAMCFIKRIFDSRNQFTKLVADEWDDYVKQYLKTVRYETSNEWVYNATAEVRKVRKKNKD